MSGTSPGTSYPNGLDSTVSNSRDVSGAPVPGGAVDPVQAFLDAGIPPMGGDGFCEDELRERSAELAMALVALVLARRDGELASVFVDKLFALNRDGAAIVLAVAHLTALRLDGVPPAGVRPDAYITTEVAPPSTPDPVEQQRHLACLRMVVKLWTGKATGNAVLYGEGMAALRHSPRDHVECALMIMARDVAARMDRMEGERGIGFEVLETHLRENGADGEWGA